MHDNAPAYAARYTTAWLRKIGIKDLMIWPPCSLDLNPNLKKEVYVAGKQYITIAAENVSMQRGN